MDLENNLEVAIIVAVVLVFMMWVVDKLKDIKSAITAKELGRLNVLIRSGSNWKLVERLEGFRFIPRVGDIIVQGGYRLPVTQIEFLRDGRFTIWTELTVEDDLEHVDSALRGCGFFATSEEKYREICDKGMVNEYLASRASGA